MILGITGPTGSGKTTLLACVRELGGQVLDCDAIYHGLLETDEALNAALCARFPEAAEAGKLSRKKLAPLVYGDGAALAELNRITHAAVLAEVKSRLRPGLAAIDAIALLESGLADLCHLTVAVTAPEEARVARIAARDGISEAHARARIAAQKDAAWFVARCDRHLENASTPEAFRTRCMAFLKECILHNA